MQDTPLFEKIVEGLVENDYVIIDQLFSESTLDQLYQNINRLYESNKMHPAGVGRNFDFQKNANIRGDVISWIDKESLHRGEVDFMNIIKQFVHFLNETCFTGLRDFEFHYAVYQTNTFYKRHLDQFKSDRGRKFSFVLYLNQNWTEENGGKLTIFQGGQEIQVSPTFGKVVIFRSDTIEHEVHPSFGQNRRSIAGWLKN